MRAILGTFTFDKAAQLREIADPKFTREECKEVVDGRPMYIFSLTLPRPQHGEVRGRVIRSQVNRVVGGDNPAANRSFYTGMRLFTGSMIAPPVSERGEAGRYIPIRF